MRFNKNGRGGPNCYPNAFGGPAQDPPAAKPSFEVSGEASRKPYKVTDVDSIQDGEPYGQ